MSQCRHGCGSPSCYIKTDPNPGKFFISAISFSGFLRFLRPFEDYWLWLGLGFLQRSLMEKCTSTTRMVNGRSVLLESLSPLLTPLPGRLSTRFKVKCIIPIDGIWESGMKFAFGFWEISNARLCTVERNWSSESGFLVIICGVWCEILFYCSVFLFEGIYEFVLWWVSVFFLFLFFWLGSRKSNHWKFCFGMEGLCRLWMNLRFSVNVGLNSLWSFSVSEWFHLLFQ